MEEFLEEYFINPIFDRVGYNPVNTFAYAVIALASVYAIWRIMRNRYDFASKEFLLGAAAFVLLGTTSRVLTDLSDAGAIRQASLSGGILGAVYGAIESRGVFQYGYLTVTPGIYVVIALLFLASIAVGEAMRMRIFPAVAGFALWIPCFLLLAPFMKNFAYGLLALLLALVGSAAAFQALARLGASMKMHHKLAVAGQALDGAATFVVIDVFGPLSGKPYFEQHVLSSAIGHATPLGFGLFFAFKIAIASLIAYMISKEKLEAKDAALLLVVIAIMGFAPGIRNLLRMLCGT
ncbi:MAG: DUF63 family protein [Candidatus Micrarchaeota archaeon]|nr:DUF63 family protein [Candidatus Micrarchaeota archaeon]